MVSKSLLSSLLVFFLTLIVVRIFPDFKFSQSWVKTNPTPTFSLVVNQAVVIRVIDGDTVELANGQRVRYIGMDTPERGKCFFQEAKQANEKLVLNKKVKLVKDVSQTDKYGRLLRYVYVGDIFVNNFLVKEGYAVIATYPPDVKYQELFLKSQRQARTNQKGLWGEGECLNNKN